VANGGSGGGGKEIKNGRGGKARGRELATKMNRFVGPSYETMSEENVESSQEESWGKHVGRGGENASSRGYRVEGTMRRSNFAGPKEKEGAAQKSKPPYAKYPSNSWDPGVTPRKGKTRRGKCSETLGGKRSNEYTPKKGD